MKHKIAAIATQAAGAYGASFGIGMVLPWLGVTVAGVLTMLFGVALERGAKPDAG